MDELTQYLYDLSLDSTHDEEAGDSVQGNGWYARFNAPTIEEAYFDILAYTEDRVEFPVGAILHEDTQGFKDSTLYYSTEELEAAWSAILEETEASEDE